MKRQHGAMAGLFLLAAATAANADDTPQFYQQVRTLQFLRDAMVQGNQEAHTVQSRLLAQMSTLYVSPSASSFGGEKNLRAAIIFALSGGNPDIASRMIRRGESSQSEEKLLRGAIAFALGQRGEASRLLADVNPISMPSELGGHIALAKSMLLPKSESRKALDLLRSAMVLMPGTLVEESAIRRAASIAAELGDRQAFEDFAGRYLRRFPSSIYAGRFLDDFAALVFRLDYPSEPEHFDLLVQLTDNLPQERRAQLYLAFSQSAVENGKLAFADFMATQASRLLTSTDAAMARVRLYQAATRIVSADYEAASELLAQVDQSQLSGSDAELLASVASVAGAIRSPFVSPPGPRRPGSLARESWPDDAIKAAENASLAISRVNELMKSAER
jgi:chemotaxis protein MotC